MICSEGSHSPSVLFFFSWFALLDSLGSRRGVIGGTADFGLSVSLVASPVRSAVVQFILPVCRVRVTYDWMRV